MAFTAQMSNFVNLRPSALSHRPQKMNESNPPVQSSHLVNEGRKKKNGAKFKFGRAERRYLSAKGVTWWMAVADNVIRQVATAPSKNGRR